MPAAPKPTPKPKPKTAAKAASKVNEDALTVAEPSGDLVEVDALCAALESAVASLPRLMNAAFNEPSEYNSQRLLRAYRVLKALGGMTEKVEKPLKDFIVQRKDLPVEPGLLTVDVGISMRTSVQWKTEALSVAAELAQVRGQFFNVADYESKTQSRYKPSASYSIAITERADAPVPV